MVLMRVRVRSDSKELIGSVEVYTQRWAKDLIESGMWVRLMEVTN
jgi:hypothetical protein